jgi:hypothetical protein
MASKKNLADALKSTANQFNSKNDGDSGMSDRKRDTNIVELKLMSEPKNDLQKPIMLNDEEAVNLSEYSNYNLDLNISEFNDSNANKQEIDFKHPFRDVSAICLIY